MQKSVILRSFGLSAALALGAFSLGCGGVEAGDGDPGSSEPAESATAPDTAAPEFPANSGQAAKQKNPYPAGPYGINPNSVAPDFEWVGYQNPSVKNDSLQTIRLSDFYNPHATDPNYVPVDAAHDDRLFQSELYGVGTKKPKALSIDIGSVWCGPCNQEAKVDLPPLHAKYKPLGGEFLLQLGDSATQGKPATPKDLFNWTKKYKVDFPSTIDPDYKLGELFAANAWPANVMIDTRTMKIVTSVAGVPQASYWAKFEKLLSAQ
jgi:hypothetical protein